MDATTSLLFVLLLLASTLMSIVALASVSGLRAQVRALERRLATLSPAGATAAAPPAPPSPQVALPGPPLQVRTPPRSPPPAPAPATHAWRAVRRWFGEGNVPVKVGMLVLFAGVAALLEYASEQGWLRMPIELRLVGVAAAALVALAFAWRQRRERRQFALGLQGGAIGVLLLVVFAAFRLYGLLSPGLAFALSVVLVAVAGALAVLQDALWLALLGLVAGFLAPLWLSSGEGNHVVLFGYYAVLNAGIFAIAWWRSWRALNVVGFVFTFAIGTAWGVLEYQPADYATTQPFLALYFAFYLLVPILQRRRGPVRRDGLDGCLVFGTPLVAFSLQAGLLEGQPERLAGCALALAAIYGGLAGWARHRERFRLLAAPYVALAVGFATLAVPLALSARATACVFALEGAALCWLGLRQDSRHQQLAGIGLQLAAGVAFALASFEMSDTALPLFANGPAMGALVIAVAGFASAWSYRVGGRAPVAGWFLAWGLAWWLGAGWHEIGRADVHPADFRMVLVVVTGWLASEVHRRLPSAALAWTATAALAAAIPFAFAQDGAHDFPLGAHGWIAWAVFAVAGWRMLGSLRGDRVASITHVAWWLAWAVLASFCLHHLAVHVALGRGWQLAATGLPWLALGAVLQWRPAWLAPPFGERFDDGRDALWGVVGLVLAFGWLAVLDEPGDPTPLAWIAVANPLDLAQVATLALLAYWLHSPGAPAAARRHRTPLLACGVFALASVIVLRACHHWGALPWALSMLDAGLAQAALTVAWSLLGVAGWILGSRRGHRALWLAGAVLMGVVLAKLLLVDRQHLGNLPGILSFLAYGVMCTVVGYLAPAPPRTGGAPQPA